VVFLFILYSYCNPIFLLDQFSKFKYYSSWLNVILSAEKEEIIENTIIKSNTYGEDNWVNSTVKKFGLEQTLRRVGRSKKQ
jgi:hypothetical protein